jgi:hypothetical protein
MLAPGFELEWAATQLEAVLSYCLVLNSMPIANTFFIIGKILTNAGQHILPFSPC